MFPPLCRLGVVPGGLLADLLASLQAATAATKDSSPQGSAPGLQSPGSAAAAAAAAAGRLGRSAASGSDRGGIGGSGGGVQRAGWLGYALVGLSPEGLAKVAWALASMVTKPSGGGLLQHPDLDAAQVQQQGQQQHAGLALALLQYLEPSIVEHAGAMDNQVRLPFW